MAAADVLPPPPPPSVAPPAEADVLPPPPPPRPPPPQAALAQWCFKTSRAELRIDGKTLFSKDVFAGNPKQGGGSHVIARFRGVGSHDLDVRVAGVWWQLVQGPTIATTTATSPVFRPVASKKIQQQ
jgi:hypothetical protein